VVPSKQPMSDVSGAAIGVDATAYLQHMIDHPPSHEPLLAALGGDPMTLKHYLEAELDLWKENKMTPIFVFDGQSVVGQAEVALLKARAGLVQTNKAWDLYGDNRPNDAVKAFGTSGRLLGIFVTRATLIPCRSHTSPRLIQNPSRSTDRAESRLQNCTIQCLRPGDSIHALTWLFLTASACIYTFPGNPIHRRHHGLTGAPPLRD